MERFAANSLITNERDYLDRIGRAVLYTARRCSPRAGGYPGLAPTPDRAAPRAAAPAAFVGLLFLPHISCHGSHLVAIGISP